MQRIGVDYEVRQALLGHRMPGMTANYSHGGPEWDRKLRLAVDGLKKAYPLSYVLSYEPPRQSWLETPKSLIYMVSRLGFEPRTLALKGLLKLLRSLATE